MSMEVLTDWIYRADVQNAFRAMLPSVPIAVAILLHAIITRPKRVPSNTAVPSKRSESRIR